MGDETRDEAGNWISQAAKKIRSFAHIPRPQEPQSRPKVGLALGGDSPVGLRISACSEFSEEHNVPIDYLAGTSVGALVAAAYAGGASIDEMVRVGCTTRFKDFAEWTISMQGLAADTRLKTYLRRFTPVRLFEELRIPLTIVATDLLTAEPVHFTRGEIGPALSASCAYPGLFRPVELDGRILVDGFLAAVVPADAVRKMGADYVIAVDLPSISPTDKPANLFEIISRSFSILMRHTEATWRPLADVVIEPDVGGFRWDDFARTPELVAEGEAAARAALPRIVAAVRPPKAEPAAGR